MVVFSLQAKADSARSITFLYRSVAVLHSPGCSWIPEHEWQLLLGGAFKLCEVRTVSKWCALWEAAGHGAQQHSCVSVFLALPSDCVFAPLIHVRTLHVALLAVWVRECVLVCVQIKMLLDVGSPEIQLKYAQINSLWIISATTGRRSKNTNWPSGVNSCESKGHICTQPL